MNDITAYTIMKDWGKFLELTSDRLLFLFGAKIPEGLLPYKKEILRKAIKKAIKGYRDQGDDNQAQLLENTLLILNLFTTNYASFASPLFLNKEIYKNKIANHLSNSQDGQLKYVLDNSTSSQYK